MRTSMMVHEQIYTSEPVQAEDASTAELQLLVDHLENSGRHGSTWDTYNGQASEVQVSVAKKTLPMRH
jgi:hypothetical protein